LIHYFRIRLNFLNVSENLSCKEPLLSSNEVIYPTRWEPKLWQKMTGSERKTYPVKNLILQVIIKVEMNSFFKLSVSPNE